MATMITSDCINCGACEPECPNTAIYQGGVEWESKGAKHPALAADVFYIVPEKCTECVGFHDHEACAAVCPVDVCIPNPDIPETEEQLIARARELHPGVDFGAEFPSRFRAGGVSKAAAAPSASASVGEGPPPTVSPAAAPVAAASEVRLDLPSLDDWEVPLECWSCHGTYAVAFKHLRTGIVLRCPFCTASYVVTTSLYADISRALQDFHRRWTEEFESFRERRRRELEEFEERQRSALESFNAGLQRLSRSVKPPGAPRKRARIFG
jgi:ferredoxin